MFEQKDEHQRQYWRNNRNFCVSPNFFLLLFLNGNLANRNLIAKFLFKVIFMLLAKFYTINIHKSPFRKSLTRRQGYLIPYLIFFHIYIYSYLKDKWSIFNQFFIQAPRYFYAYTEILAWILCLCWINFKCTLEFLSVGFYAYTG